MRESRAPSSYESFFCGGCGVGELVALAWRMKIVLLIGWILVAGKNLSCEGFHPASRVKMGWFKAATIGERERVS